MIYKTQTLSVQLQQSVVHSHNRIALSHSSQRLQAKPFHGSTMRIALFVLGIVSVPLFAAATDRVSPLPPIGSDRPKADIIASAVQQIDIIRRQMERNILLSGDETFDQIYTINDVIAVGSVDFDIVIRAERSWTAGGLAANDLHVNRGLLVMYGISQSTRSELGNAGTDVQINAIINHAGDEMLASVDKNRAAVELLSQAAIAQAVDLHNRAQSGIGMGNSPIPYQNERVAQLDSAKQRVSDAASQMLNEIKAAIDDALRQLSALPTLWAGRMEARYEKGR